MGYKNPVKTLRSDEVFLSFRGEDTHASFTSHLHTSLRNAGITVFMDDDSLERGGHISTSLLQSIRESRISVVVFSRNYADSQWCLGELVTMMKCRRTVGQVILPVFYDVDPSEVRHQIGEFGKAFQNLLNRISGEEEEERNWREALREAAGLAGFVVLNSRNESEAIKNIVQQVTCLLDKTDLFVCDNPVGVESRVQDITQLLDIQQSNDVLLLGIWGMGGSGKTTIAKAIYNQIGRNFEGRSFLANIREAWEQTAGQVYLQEQLLFDISKETTTKIQSSESGKNILEDRLCHKRVFLVLDDVNKLDQVNALCGSRKWFGSGSRIIITTRDMHILRGNRVDQVFEMNAMNQMESIELFSWHAFKQPFPRKDFVGISRNIVEYFGGLPLALEVLGSYLFDRGLTEWVCVLEKLQKIPDDQVQRKLKISYDGLNDDIKKEIFLDIAFFFIGMDRNDVIHKLNGYGLSAEIGISVLVERNLITINDKNKLGMHELLRDMGREIIREKSPKDPEERRYREYGVFLSFRGEDTRSSFTSHLHASLINAGITVFMDDHSLQSGDHISTSLLLAIEQSQISIVVFSRNYADSRWCLEELVKIMEWHRTRGQVVLPVFYGVDPSEVRRQTGEFGNALQNLLKRISKEKEKKEESLYWREALCEAACLAGSVVQNFRNDNKAIKDIVEKVIRLLDKTSLFVAKNPVGVESRVQDMIRKLDIQKSDNVLALGLCGMGGIGKTTIAKAIYNEIGHNFEGRSFLAGIGEAWKQTTQQVYLQEQLLSDIFKGMTIKIQSIDFGKNILKDRLCGKRVLLVLDDINEMDQLNALCGSLKWFGLGTRIIITTRDSHILEESGVDKVHIMKEMDAGESIKLFSWHAFKQASPKEDFAEVSKNIVKYTGGLPLALEVLGSYLFGREVKEWKCVLEKLNEIPNRKVLKKLKISYDLLDDYSQKAIFLDIACFFIGMDRNDVINILNGCGLFAENGLSVLVERSLVVVDDRNKLGMHDLLRDMGRKIVRDESEKEPEERSRLWSHEDIDGVLSGQTGTKAIEGLALKLSRASVKCFSTKAFKKMKKLRLLHLDGVQLDGDFEYLSKKLKWLCWNRFPLPCIPPNFYQGNLVSIELENSNVKLVWEETQTQRMEKLKILNLSHSYYLTQTPDFSNMPNLEKLVLTDCRRLSKVSNSIGHLNKILLINLENCVSLHNLPRNIYKLKSLQKLILSGCLMIDNLEEDVEQMESLTTLIANNTAITRVPFSLVRSKSIKYISLCGYEGISHDVFPSIILSWMSPTNNIPSPFQPNAAMSSLVSLDIPNSSSHELSSISKYLPRLQSLCVKCSSEFQLSQDAAIILNALYAMISKESESTATTSQVSNMKTSAVIQCCNQVHILGSKNSLKSLSIQMGMNCHVSNFLKENILQKMHVSGCSGCLFPSDSYPDWLTFNCEGSSIIFEVPQVEGRNLKTILMCIVYSSAPDNMTSNDLKNMLVINHTKATIQLYKGEALVSFENEEGQRVVSSIEPGNKVEVVVVFEKCFIVKKTAVYLIYDEPVCEKVGQCDAPDENAIDCIGDENECTVRSISPQVEPTDELWWQQTWNWYC